MARPVNIPGQGRPLTARERQAAELSAGGASSREIAAALGMSFRTVQTHLRSAREKTRSRNREELAGWLAARP